MGDCNPSVTLVFKKCFPEVNKTHPGILHRDYFALKLTGLISLVIYNDIFAYNDEKKKIRTFAEYCAYWNKKDPEWDNCTPTEKYERFLSILPKMIQKKIMNLDGGLNGSIFKNDWQTLQDLGLNHEVIARNQDFKNAARELGSFVVGQIVKKVSGGASQIAKGQTYNVERTGINVGFSLNVHRPGTIVRTHRIVNDGTLNFKYKRMLERYGSGEGLKYFEMDLNGLATKYIEKKIDDAIHSADKQPYNLFETHFENEILNGFGEAFDFLTDFVPYVGEIKTFAKIVSGIYFGYLERELYKMELHNRNSVIKLNEDISKSISLKLYTDFVVMSNDNMNLLLSVLGLKVQYGLTI